MTFTLLICIALIGAATLGYLSAWYGRQEAIGRSLRKKSEVEKKLIEANTNATRFETETKAHQLTLDTLRKQNQTVENEVIKLQTDLRILEGEMQVLQRENRNLATENQLLNDDLKNNIHEIEVIREIPVFETKNGHANEEETLDLEKRIENAKRLVNAFKKGVSENSNTPAE